jgi:hypothetical protein
MGKRPWCILPLAVVTSAAGKQRLILDARVVNAFLQYYRFQYEKITELLWDAVPGGFLTQKDSAAGYHHVYMDIECWSLLGFALEGEWYVFACLPFGLSHAPWAFTRLLQHVYALPRAHGRSVTAMVDDSAWVTATQQEGAWRSYCTARLEAALGCVHKVAKSRFWPVQRGVFWGSRWTCAVGGCRGRSQSFSGYRGCWEPC